MAKSSISDKELKKVTGGYVQRTASGYSVHDNITDQEVKTFDGLNDDQRKAAELYDEAYHEGLKNGFGSGYNKGFDKGHTVANIEANEQKGF